MIIPLSKRNPNIHTKRGFALIATILLMVLLAIITVGTLSLSAVTLRNGGNESAQKLANSNARMALMIAIGELQKHTGPDTRITAPSNIYDPSGPPLIGVWKSWEGTDHESTGRPHAPDYDAKQTERFLGWLVSGERYGETPAEALTQLAHSQPQNTGTLATIPLISTGTLGNDSLQQVHVYPVKANESGTYAWWVSGENQKARLPLPHGPADRPYGPFNDTVAGWADFAKSHGATDPEPFDLDTILTDPSMPATRAFSRATTDFIASPDAEITPREYFHDLSINSVGLLTNTATGGWRKDMSLMTENYANLPSSDLPFFRLTPDGGAVTQVTKPTANSVATAKASNSILYPWATYPTPGISREAHGPVSSWPNLVDYATAYKRITPSGNSNSLDATPRPWASTAASAAAPFHDYLHKLRITPVIARIHWKFAHRTIRNNMGTPADTSDDTFTPQMLMTPVITLWNPYNVSITCSRAMNIRLAKPLPVAFRHYRIDANSGTRNALNFKKLIVGIPNDWPNSGYNVDTPYPAYSGAGHINHVFPNNTFTLAPGETRVFSPTNTATMPSRSQGTNPTLNMNVGYRPNNGLIFSNLDSTLVLRAGDPVLVDAAFDATSYSLGTTTRAAPYDPIRESVRLYIHVFADGGENYDSNMMMENSMAYSKATASTYWPPIPYTEFPQPTAAELSLGWQPFLSTVFGPRVASDSHLPGKGLVQNSPTLAVDAMTQWSSNSGVNHPVNAPYDYSFLKHTGAGDNNLPNIQSGTNRGFIVSGFDASEGLTRCVMSELPLRPLASIAELTNWDFRGQNRQPPYQLNIIGNSDATPLLHSNRVYISNNTNSFQYDDPYCANHLLFDDWFFSSIAPDPTNFGKTIARTQRIVYQEFLDGTRALANQAYRPITEDVGLSSDNRDEVIDSMLDSTDGWQKVASRFEVEGMFNVNSTSVKAWRSLLGHARNQKIPYHAETGVILSGSDDHRFSRFTVASDVKAGDAGMSGSFPEASEFTGYRVFTEELLDTLAEKIVEQVKARGPFLSLSEFVNRRLDAATDERATAGAIQTALNKMGQDAGDDSPFKTLQDLSGATQIDPPGDEDYRFPQAAAGHGSYGLPGWVRQADVLRPLAPILSARDDTFTIRAYGDARDKNGNVLAKAWCEATVHRTRDFVDPADAPDTIDAPTSSTNVRFGRRYIIRSFRWLSPNEV